jgi:hypothetical protein
MNKKLLSIAVAGAVASGSAYAVDLADADGGTPQYVASEATIKTTGQSISGVTVVASAGFSLGATDRYMRYDLSSGTWGATQATSALTGTNLTVVAVAAGGATTDSFVIFQVNAGSSSIASANDITYAPNSGVTVLNEDDVNITYALFETATAASANSGNSLASDTGPLLRFTAINNTTAKSVASDAAKEKIDVTQGSTYFDGGTNDTRSLIGSYQTTDVTSPANINTVANGASNTVVVEANHALTVTGDFSFVQDLTNNAPDGTYTNSNVYLSTTNDCLTGTNANVSSLNATTASWSSVANNITGASQTNQVYICVNANGKSIIPEQTFTGSYVSAAQTNYDSETTSLSLETLSKNGSSTTLHLALKPGGAFSNYIRIVNTSNVTGDVSYTLYNDSGDSVSGIDLVDVEGVSTSELKGQASTNVIKIDDMYAAAQAKDSTFDVGNGKLRVVIDGEFSSITAQSITLSTDNTSFTTF